MHCHSPTVFIHPGLSTFPQTSQPLAEFHLILSGNVVYDFTLQSPISMEN